MERDNGIGSSRASQQWLASLSQPPPSTTTAASSQRDENPTWLREPPSHLAPAPLALTASSTVVLVPNPKQHALPEQQTHILPDASQVVGSHTWKVAAYKDALTRKLPLVGRCSFIQHGLCHVCTATATTNTNPALVLNVCPHFDFGHSVCVVHFEQLTRTLVSSMLEQGGGGGVPACPVCLHGCICAVCTRVLTTQIELYDAYRASTSTSRGPSEYQGDVAANSLSPPWLHPNATSSGDVSVRQASITTSATRERTTSTRPTPPSYHGLIDADNLSDAASAQLWRRKPSSLLPPMMQADAKQATDELVRRVGPDSVTGFSPSSKATHHPTTRAGEHPDGTGVVPSYPDVGPAQRRWESHPAHDEAKHTQDDDNHVSRDSGLIDGAAVTADEKKSPAAAMLPLQSFKETQRKQQAGIVQQPKAASKAIAPTTTLTAHGGKQGGGGMAAEPKGGLAIAPKQASKDIGGTTSHTALKRSAAKAHERGALPATKENGRPTSTAKPWTNHVNAMPTTRTTTTTTGGDERVSKAGVPTTIQSIDRHAVDNSLRGSSSTTTTLDQAICSKQTPRLNPASTTTTTTEQAGGSNVWGIAAAIPSKSQETPPPLQAKHMTEPRRKTPVPSSQISTTNVQPSAKTTTQPVINASAVERTRTVNPKPSTPLLGHNKTTLDDPRVDKPNSAQTTILQPTEQPPAKTPAELGTRLVVVHEAAIQHVVDSPSPSIPTSSSTNPTPRPPPLGQSSSIAFLRESAATGTTKAWTIDRAKELAAEVQASLVNTDNLVKQWMSDKKKQAGAGTSSSAPNPLQVVPPRHDKATSQPSKRNASDPVSTTTGSTSKKATSTPPLTTATTAKPDLTATSVVYKRRPRTVASSIGSTTSSSSSRATTNENADTSSGLLSSKDVPAMAKSATLNGSGDVVASTRGNLVGRPSLAKRDENDDNGASQQQPPPPVKRLKRTDDDGAAVSATRDRAVRTRRTAAPALLNAHDGTNDPGIAQTSTTMLASSSPSGAAAAAGSGSTTTKTIGNAMSLEGGPPSSVTESNNPRKRPASETCETTKRGRPRRGDQTAAAAAAVAVAVAIAASTTASSSSSSMRKGVDTHDGVAELVASATTPTSRRPASSKKKAKRSHDDDEDDEATSPSAPGKRVTIKRETPVDDDVKIESDDDDDVDTNLDFCSICKQDGDLVCCDVCPRSFHLTCLNKREDQLPLDTWQCHECQHNLSDTHVQKVCRDLTKLRNKALTMRSILTGICSHPFAKPFLAPVADVEYYDDVVEYRMDLSEVSSRLDRHEYDGDDLVSNAFVRDVQLVWDNCRLFNDDNSGLARAANTLDADFHKMLQAAAATKNSRGAIRTKKQ
ncbi:hypothetical protein, variant [Aphanomyces astaci]|uniref:PHD-type domain-containing protein n=1 Tax=Aphanomyces astaci TaxID=112090 RepID=W4G0T3_APHAT|nr:hypothetical protein, variant [Aphanomyces astaci]ETV73317.1 hypothetical protein, variant [Aphanomyces astaci]|eukprot:XP_009837191.1 hypothetical protein, variant [Aphanomyces astaci]